VQVGKEVLAHPAADPQLLDVVVAEVAVLQRAESLRYAITVEGRPAALPLQQVRPEHAERGDPERDDEHQVGPPAGRRERGRGERAHAVPTP